jgi:flagellar biosynthesis repressor protein FlbT
MALKITLKPHERLIVGGAVVTNGNAKSDLLIENNVPILREKDILSEKDADSPCKRIYFVIQLMYVDEKNLADHHTLYWKLVRDVVKAAPSMIPLVDQISEHILHNSYYQALKKAKKLIEYEQEVISRVRKPT